MTKKQEFQLKNNAVDTSVTAIAFGNPDGVLSYVNNSFLRMWGAKDKSELLGKPAVIFWEDRQQAEHVVSEIHKSGYWTGEMKAKKLDGSLFDAHLSASAVVDRNGRVSHLMATFVDISSMKNAEAVIREQAEQFHVFKNATQDGFMLVGPGGELKDVNEAYCRMTGYSVEELTKMRVPDLEAAETPDDTSKHIEHILKNGSDFFQSRHRRKDGISFDVEVSVVYWEKKNQIFSFVRDITQRMQEQRELERLKENLENLVARRTNELHFALEAAKKANHAKTRFLSRMSHELRTPLNAIIGFSQLFEIDGNDTITEDNKEYIREILKAGNNLLGLIDTMLEFSALNEKLHELHIEDVECTPVILECLRQMEPAAAERKITLIPEIAQSCSVKADRERFQQILQNLLSNAIKYNNENGKVNVQCVVHAGCVRITVTDTGIGIPREYHDVIFEPFEKAETDFDGKSGAGIGLAMTKELVEEMGGIVGMESSEGTGSSFWFELPDEKKACTEEVL